MNFGVFLVPLFHPVVFFLLQFSLVLVQLFQFYLSLVFFLHFVLLKLSTTLLVYLIQVIGCLYNIKKQAFDDSNNYYTYGNVSFLQHLLIDKYK